MMRFSGLIAGGLLAVSGLMPPDALAQTQTLRISTTERLITTNPYGDSNSQMYSIWCQIYGCLGVYDWQQKKYVGMLAQSWEIVGPKTWRFHLRTDLKRHDGGPGPTAKDVVHAFQRILADPESTQRSVVADVADVTAVDEHTVDFHTKAPNAPFLSFLFDRLAVTSNQLYTKLGRDADNKAAFGWGPYKLDEFVIDQRVVLSRNDSYPGIDQKTPKRVIYQTIMEAEQRVTALLNGEVEIARLIPPQLVNRVENRSDVNVVKTDSIEQIFLGLNNAFKPWDDVRVRRAASHAIDRDLIIQKLLNGEAARLDGPVGGKPQICYAGGVKGAYAYDPALAKKLLAEAGYKDGGPDIELLTSSNRLISDKLASEVIAQMLTRVGFRVKLQVLEYAKLWSLVRPGKAPTYYFNRGSVFDATDSMAQYFETGGSPRIGYSNPKFDDLISRVRQEFDETKRCTLMNEAAELIVNDAPVVHLWTHALVSGVRKGITYPANASGELWLMNIRM
jgi:peptide/nickel transport system substrate-binding protein